MTTNPIDALKKLENEKDILFKKTIKGWRHTLDMWEYYGRIDFIISFLNLIAGIMIGLSLGGLFR